jgi:predicted unusual protein kinase regulating ubiquinone biosynthesis (AarF/ABC1/UbiB family)
MSDIPKWAISRSAKLAGLPIGFAGRTALGFGKRIGGRPAEMVASELQQRTAEQLFKVLGELKGGAMKFGQALSVFEAALPEELGAPYRAALTKLQDSAPPMPAQTVQRVLAKGLGPDWRENFTEWSDKPAAAASIGQVHRAIWHDGREVAVKLQYPGAGNALLSDLNQLARLARLFAVVNPGLDVKPLIAELKARVAEELDYSLEAASQAAFGEAYDGDPDIQVPKVVQQSGNVLVTEWVDGTPLSAIIANGTKEQRDRAGLLFVRFLFSGPARVGLLHADPHPGNYRITEDGRLGVLDYGAVNRLPDGLPPAIGPLARLALEGRAQEVLDGLRAEGFVPADLEVDADAVLEYVLPMLGPVREETFHFTRPWLRQEAARVADPRSPANALGRQLNLPPTYLLIHRVTLGGIGVLCQLDAEAAFGAEMRRWVPGFAADGSASQRPTVTPDERIPTPDETAVATVPAPKPKPKPKPKRTSKPASTRTSSAAHPKATSSTPRTRKPPPPPEPAA